MSSGGVPKKTPVRLLGVGLSSTELRCGGVYKVDDVKQTVEYVTSTVLLV